MDCSWTKRLWRIIIAALLTCGIAGAQEKAPRAPATGQDIGRLRASKLRCLIGNNKAYQRHNPGYNGIFSLSSPDQEESPFVSSYAGFNLEHYFDIRKTYEGDQRFEPRFSPIDVERPDKNTVVLHQPPTPNFGVESWSEFKISEPYYIDFKYTCKPHKKAFQGDTMGIFWASYIDAPIDKSIYFLDADSILDRPVWRQLCTQEHNRDSTVRHKDDDSKLEFEDPGTALFSSFSPLRYSEPFYYGRFRNMVLIYIFEPNKHLRFAHSPSGGGQSDKGDDTNPAWDFQLIVPGYEVDKTYELKGRLVYKVWKGREDVIEEVRKFRKR